MATSNFGVKVFGFNKHFQARIPVSRLRDFLRRGDIIDGNHALRVGAWWVEYRVTHVDWWGVYAYPTEKCLEEYDKGYIPEVRKKARRHFKFKWRHITAVSFLEKDELWRWIKL